MAKAEIAKHFDGELTVRPLSSTGSERRAEIRGRAKLNSLLEGQEAVCAEVVAGGCNAMAIWQDLVDDYGFTGRYSSVRRLVAKLRSQGNPSNRIPSS